MKQFEWANAASDDDAVKLLAPGAAADFDEMSRPMGGGQDLLTTMKSYITTPGRVVNLKTIPDRGRISFNAADGLTLGATATLSDIADHADVQRFAPGLVEAIHSVATPQIRNVGTVGGNLCQRPRCWYFRLENIKCLKRGGDTCYAIDGENKYNAIFGDGPCVITHPSDLAPMFIALGAIITAAGANGTRDIPAAGFFRMPTKDDPKHENVLPQDAFITQVRIPPTPLATKSIYLKFKERSSLDFAMASVAAAVDLGQDRTVRSARVVLGGVAPVPWPLLEVDKFLAGKRLDDAIITRATDMAVEKAKPLSQNGYKIPLTRALVRRALLKLA